MIALLTFFSVLVLSLLVVRVATVALTLTGLSQDAARFQARSAWTGTGFTTEESERITTHPVRRRIVATLMLLRSAGLITAVSSLILGFIGAQQSEAGIRRLSILLVALLILWLLSASNWVDRWMAKVIRRLLIKYTDLDTRDYGALLHLSENYAVGELRVGEDDWLEGRTLGDLKLSDEGVLVLGVERAGGNYVGAPRGDLEVREGDLLLIYAPRDRLKALDQRPRGWQGQAEHYRTAREQSAVEQREHREDEAKRAEREAKRRAQEASKRDTDGGAKE